jgi:hypothetical protein
LPTRDRRIEAGTRIVDCNQCLVSLVGLHGYPEEPRTIGNIAHCLNAIANQVEQNLLQLEQGDPRSMAGKPS